jgi:multidrug efflux pump subunit AcrA (membrane-fusion protein)
VGDAMTAEFRPVTLGQHHGDRVVVTSGVKPGERVVTAAHMFVMPGGKVKVQEPALTEAKDPGR